MSNDQKGFVCVRENGAADNRRHGYVTFQCVGPAGGNRRYLRVNPLRAAGVGDAIFTELALAFTHDRAMLYELLKVVNDVRDDIDVRLNRLRD